MNAKEQSVAEAAQHAMAKPDGATGAAQAAGGETMHVGVRHVHHQRGFGIGYGNSSGYGSVLHFTDGHEDALFRLRW